MCGVVLQSRASSLPEQDALGIAIEVVEQQEAQQEQNEQYEEFCFFGHDAASSELIGFAMTTRRFVGFQSGVQV